MIGLRHFLVWITLATGSFGHARGLSELCLHPVVVKALGSAITVPQGALEPRDTAFLDLAAHKLFEDWSDLLFDVDDPEDLPKAGDVLARFKAQLLRAEWPTLTQRAKTHVKAKPPAGCETILPALAIGHVHSAKLMGLGGSFRIKKICAMTAAQLAPQVSLAHLVSDESLTNPSSLAGWLAMSCRVFAGPIATGEFGREAKRPPSPPASTQESLAKNMAQLQREIRQSLKVPSVTSLHGKDLDTFLAHGTSMPVWLKGISLPPAAGDDEGLQVLKRLQSHIPRLFAGQRAAAEALLTQIPKDAILDFTTTLRRLGEELPRFREHRDTFLRNVRLLSGSEAKVLWPAVSETQGEPFPLASWSPDALTLAPLWQELGDAQRWLVAVRTLLNEQHLPAAYQIYRDVWGAVELEHISRDYSGTLTPRPELPKLEISAPCQLDLANPDAVQRLLTASQPVWYLPQGSCVVKAHSGKSPLDPKGKTSLQLHIKVRSDRTTLAIKPKKFFRAPTLHERSLVMVRDATNPEAIAFVAQLYGGRNSLRGFEALASAYEPVFSVIDAQMKRASIKERLTHESQPAPREALVRDGIEWEKTVVRLTRPGTLAGDLGQNGFRFFHYKAKLTERAQFWLPTMFERMGSQDGQAGYTPEAFEKVILDEILDFRSYLATQLEALVAEWGPLPTPATALLLSQVLQALRREALGQMRTRDGALLATHLDRQVVSQLGISQSSGAGDEDLNGKIMRAQALSAVMHKASTSELLGVSLIPSHLHYQLQRAALILPRATPTAQIDINLEIAELAALYVRGVALLRDHPDEKKERAMTPAKAAMGEVIFGLQWRFTRLAHLVGQAVGREVFAKDWAELLARRKGDSEEVRQALTELAQARAEAMLDNPYEIDRAIGG